MTTALYVRETVELSDATEQRFLSLARHKGLQPGDSLTVAARTVTATPGYVLDLRDPADPGDLLHMVLIVDGLDASGLIVEMSGDPARWVTGGGRGRSAQIWSVDTSSQVTTAGGSCADGGVDGTGGLRAVADASTCVRGVPSRPRGHIGTTGSCARECG